MIAGFCNSDFKEVWITKHGIGCSVATARMAPDTGAVDIDPGESAGEFLHAGDLIWKSVVAHVSEIRVMKFLRTPRSSHPIDLHDDESQFGQCLRVRTRSGKIAAADASGLRAGINTIHDRVLL